MPKGPTVAARAVVWELPGKKQLNRLTTKSSQRIGIAITVEPATELGMAISVQPVLSLNHGPKLMILTSKMLKTLLGKLMTLSNQVIVLRIHGEEINKLWSNLVLDLSFSVIANRIVHRLNNAPTIHCYGNYVCSRCQLEVEAAMCSLSSQNSSSDCLGQRNKCSPTTPVQTLALLMHHVEAENDSFQLYFCI